jgi:ATP-dependent DNA helicase RecG
VSLPTPGSLSAYQLLRLIAKGEQDQVEFKGRTTSTEQLISTVVCFANAEGGLILSGVESDSRIRGSRLRDANSFRKTVYHSTAPSQVVTTQLIETADGDVLAIWVEHSPVIVSTRSGIYSKRVGTECVPMTPDLLLVRQIDTHSIDFSVGLTAVSFEAVDELEVQRFRQQLPDQGGANLRSLSTQEMLLAIGAAQPINGEHRLTVAGLLIFGHERVIRDHLPAHEVVFLRSPSGGTEYERRMVSSAPLLRLIEQLQSEVEASGRIRRLRLGTQDIEVPDYPGRVVREAIVNALAHRHFMLPGDVVIRQTSTTIEIENPGGFPEGITPETVIQHAPVHRNRLLCEILDRVRYMERSGLGVDRIFEDQLRYGKLPPVYVADRTMVRLHLDSSEFDEPFARFVLEEERDGRTWRVEELLAASYLRRMGPTERGALARTIQRPEEEVQDIIAGLLDEDLLDRFGSGAGTRYALSARVQATLGAEAAYTKERGLAREYQNSIILQHARQFGRVDNKTVREILDLSMSEARYLLRGMQRRRQVVKRGSRRWAYYVPAKTS